MMSLKRQALSRQGRCGITPRMAIMGHRERTIRASIVTLEHRCQHLADVLGEGIDFTPCALDSTGQA
jgi:hypothetical protein